MFTITTRSVRLSIAALVLGIGVTATSESLAQPVTFSFTKKLDLNPRPFADAAHNAYWRGTGKYSNSHDVWKVTTTLHVADKFPNPVTGLIEIEKMHFRAVNKKTGDVHQVDLKGWISPLDNTVLLKGPLPNGFIATLTGVVRSWWTVRGVRKGANVVQGVLSFSPPPPLP